MKDNLIVRLKKRILQYGFVQIQMRGTGADRFIKMCLYRGVILYDVRVCSEGYLARLSLYDFFRIRQAAAKANVFVKIIKKKGLPFLIKGLHMRFSLIAACGSAAALVYICSLFIWNISITGNYSVTDDMIMKYLKTCGIGNGSLTSSISTARLAADLRDAFGQITWVSAAKEGTELRICISEGTCTDASEQNIRKPCDIRAAFDGQITDMITRTGTALVKKGDQVKKGDLLVAGRIAYYDDSEQETGYQYCTADADITAVRTYRYYEKRSVCRPVMINRSRPDCAFLLQLGELRLGFPMLSAGAQDVLTVREKKQLHFGQYYFPVYYTKIMRSRRLCGVSVLTKKQLKQRVEEDFASFLKKIRQKGVQLFQNNVKIEESELFCVASGTLTVLEPIGIQSVITLKETGETETT